MTTSTFTYSALVASNSRTVMSTYQTDVLRLLKDKNGTIYNQTDVFRCVNEARRKVAADFGCLRALQQIILDTNVEANSWGTIPAVQVSVGGSGYVAPTLVFTGGNPTTPATATVNINSTTGAITSIAMTNKGAGYDPSPANPIVATLSDGAGTGAALNFGAIGQNTIAMLGVHVIWTTSRYTLDWETFSIFSAKFRYWLNWQNRPAIWAQYGQGQFYVAPKPDQQYLAEVDTVVYPDDINDTTTVDPIALEYQDPIKFYACYLLKMGEQSFGEAKWFLEQYRELVNMIGGDVYVRRIPSMYNDQGTLG